MGSRNLKKVTDTSNINAAPPAGVNAPGDGLAICMPRKALRALVQRFQSVVDKRSTMPILSYVTLRANTTGLEISGTDLNVSMRVTTACAVYRSGAISVPAKRLGEILKAMPDGDIVIAVNARVTTITCGTATAMIDGLSDRDAPKFPELGDAQWSRVDAGEIAGLLGRVQHAICKDETRFHLNGTLLEATDTVLRAVSTDGHRLAKAETWTGDTTLRTKGVIVPRKGVSEIVKLFGAKGATGDIAITTKNTIWCRSGEITLVVKLIDAQFPPYEQVIPRANPCVVTVNREALVGAVTRAKVNCNSTRGIELQLATGKLEIRSSDPDAGETRETIDATCDVPGKRDLPVKIGVNPTYLLEALENLDDTDEHVTIAIGDQLDPMLVRSLDDYAMAELRDARLLAVIMPMRI